MIGSGTGAPRPQDRGGGLMPRPSGGNSIPDAVPDGTRIGAQLKAARLAARKSMAEVAEQAGLTKDRLQELRAGPRERLGGLAHPALRGAGRLRRLPVRGLDRRGSTARRPPPVNFGGRQMKSTLTPSGEKRVQAIISDIEPGGGSGDEPYSLPADVEFVFVLAGQLQITVAGSKSPSNRVTPSPSRPAPSTPSARPRQLADQVLWILSPALPDTGPDVQQPAGQPPGAG